MVQLVLVYCMVSNASVCTEDRPVYEQALSLSECENSGQFAAAEYTSEHPQWRLVTWRCEVNVARRTAI